MPRSTLESTGRDSEEITSVSFFDFQISPEETAETFDLKVDIAGSVDVFNRITRPMGSRLGEDRSLTSNRILNTLIHSFQVSEMVHGSPPPQQVIQVNQSHQDYVFGPNPAQNMGSPLSRILGPSEGSGELLFDASTRSDSKDLEANDEGVQVMSRLFVIRVIQEWH
jgi:hypothetical protein